MDRHENERWGRYAEWVARLALSLTEDRSTFHDARDGEGRPVEIKACKLRTGAREDPGKFFIREENHRELRDADGLYVFVLYDPSEWKQGPILEIEVKPAEWLDEMDGYTWTDNGSRRGETVRRPPWTAVFADRDDSRVSEDSAAA